MKFFRLASALLFVTLLCACFFAAGQENSQQPKETIQVSVDRVSVGVIVTDSRGQFVEGLRHEDFRVFDNEIEQPLTGFAAGEEPAQVLLLIEAGPAVYLLEGGHVQAAVALLNGLSNDDRVAVVKYADSPTALLDFTVDKQAALAAFGELRFNLGFGSLNLTSSVSKVLEWLASVQGKKTIVLLSTGVDTSSTNESALAMQQLKVSDVRLLAVSLAGDLQNPEPASKKKTPATNFSKTAAQFEQAKQLLKGMAEATGGRAYFPTNAKEFSSVYVEIAQLVRHEYSLAFAPPARDGLVHAIGVRVEASQKLPANGSGRLTAWIIERPTSRRPDSESNSDLPTTRKVARRVNTSTFVGTNPTGELITRGLPVDLVRLLCAEILAAARIDMTEGPSLDGPRQSAPAITL